VQLSTISRANPAQPPKPRHPVVVLSELTPHLPPRLHPDLARLSEIRLAQPTSTPLLEPPLTVAVGQPELPLPGVRPSTAVESPLDPRTRAIVASLVAALVETISGRRPAHHLGEWVSAEVMTLLEQLARTHRGAGITLRSIRAQTPRPGVVEVAAHLAQDGRSRAAAIHLVRRHHRWQAIGMSIALSPDQINQSGGAA